MNKSNNRSALKLLKEIQSLLQTRTIILYRFEQKLNRFKWLSALLAPDQNLDTLKIIKNIHIPASAENLVFKTHWEKEAKIVHILKSEIQALYEKESIGIIARDFELCNVPLIYKDKIQGIVLAAQKKLPDFELINGSIQDSIPTWSRNLAIVNSHIDQFQAKQRDVYQTQLDNKEINESAVFYIDLNPKKLPFSRQNQKLVAKFYNLVYAIILEKIHGSSTQLLHTNSNSILIYNQQLKTQLPLFLKQINDIIDWFRTHESEFPYFQLRFGFIIGKFFYIEHHHTKALSGPDFEKLEKIARSSLNNKIQTNKNTAQKIQAFQDLKLRGKLKLSKTVSESVYLFD